MGKALATGALLALMALPCAAQDAGYAIRSRNALIDGARSAAASHAEEKSTGTARRRPVGLVENTIQFPYVPPEQHLRVAITNPSNAPCPVTIRHDTMPIESFTLPPGMTWVTEDSAMMEGSISTDCAAVAMKVGRYGMDPIGFYGHTPELRRTSDAMRSDGRQCNMMHMPAPDNAGMDLRVAVKNTGRERTIISPSIVQSYEDALFSYSTGKEWFIAEPGQYGIGNDIAKDSDDGFITRIPNAPIFGPSASAYAVPYTDTGKCSATPVLGEAIITHNGRNNDSYAAALRNERVEWAVILGVANRVPASSANTDTPMEYTTIPTFISGEGAMYIGVATNTHTSGSHHYGSKVVFPGRRNDVPLAQPSGTYSALELACERGLIPFASTQLTDERGLIAVERNIIGTEKDLIRKGEVGIAAMIGEYRGARTEIDLYAKRAALVRIDVFNDLGELFGSTTYAMGTSEYRRVPLTEIAQCAPHPELTYGHARLIVLDDGEVLGGFSRIDNGGGDKVVGKFERMRVSGLHDGRYPDIICPR